MTNHLKNISNESIEALKDAAKALEKLAEQAENDDSLWFVLNKSDYFNWSIDELSADMKSDADEADDERNRKTIGVWTLTNTQAVELLGIEHGFEDVAIIREPDGIISEHEIDYSDEVPCVRIGGIDGLELPFDECMRA